MKTALMMQNLLALYVVFVVKGATVYNSILNYTFNDGTEGYYYHTDTMHDDPGGSETYTINFPPTVEDLGLTTFPRFDTLFKTIEMVAHEDSKYDDVR